MQEHSAALLLAMLRTAEVPFNARIRTQSCRANRRVPRKFQTYIYDRREKRKRKEIKR